MTVDHPRRVRSFVRRPGRITTGQRRALEKLMPRWGIALTDGPLDLDAAFGRKATRILDIGFGDGEALLSAAARYPSVDYLGIEVHEPGIGHLLTLIGRAGLSNIRIVNADAVDVLDRMLPGSSFDAVNLFFPDPWPKKRHHKRRIVTANFLASAAKVLKPAGVLHIATDWANYAEQISELIGESPLFERVEAEAVGNDRLTFRAPTKFERRGRALGHEVADFLCRKRRDTPG